MSQVLRVIGIVLGFVVGLFIILGGFFVFFRIIVAIVGAVLGWNDDTE